MKSVLVKVFGKGNNRPWMQLRDKSNIETWNKLYSDIRRKVELTIRNGHYLYILNEYYKQDQ